MEEEEKAWHSDLPDSRRLEIEAERKRQKRKIEENDTGFFPILSYQGIKSIFKWFRKRKKGN